MKHVYDWLDEKSTNQGEKDAKEFLGQFTRPAFEKDNDWLAKHTLRCTFRGKRYICSGASRMGDVWLKGPHSENFYDMRVDVAYCSDWKLHVKRTTPKLRPKVCIKKHRKHKWRGNPSSCARCGKKKKSKKT